MLTLADIDGLTGGRLGVRDVPCPWCGPDRRSPSNRRRPVLRVWRTDPDFASWCCARCGERGYALDRAATGLRRPPSAAEQLARVEARAAADASQRAAHAKRGDLARFLWSRREYPHGTPAETYLRQARGYGGSIPGTIGFLPGRGEHPPAMIAAFGIPDEMEPGLITIAERALTGVHLTKLRPDGSAKAGTDRDKIMIGHSVGTPLVLSPMNDLLGLAIIEGIEKGLRLVEASGLGVWVAGAAARMPALAAAVPDYADCVTVCADDDQDGLRHARTLQTELTRRGIYAELLVRS